MSDNLLKAIKEQGRHISSLRCGMGTSDAIQSLDDLVDMVQAAHDAEIAKLKEDVADITAKRDGAIEQYLASQKDWRTAYAACGAANERIAYLEGLVALQANALLFADEYYCFGNSEKISQAISSSAG